MTRWLRRYGPLLLLVAVGVGVTMKVLLDLDPAAPVGEEDSVAAEGGERAGNEGAALSAPDEGTQEVREPESGLLRGRVVSSSGEPVVGALVVLYAEDEALDDFRPTPSDLWTLGVRPAAEKVTDGHGAYSFDDLPAEVLEVPVALWCSAVGYRPQGRMVVAREVLGGLDLTLDPAPGIRVRVLHDGEPVAGVEVGQLSHRNALGGNEALYLAFHRIWTTDELGEVTVVAPTWHHWLVARHGDLESRAWIGTDTSELVLELFPTFTVRGRVNATIDASEKAPIVRCLEVDGGNLAMCRVRKSGEWGPVRLPTVATTVRYTLEAGDFLPGPQFLDSPSAGQTLFVDFDPKPGIAVQVRVTEPSGAAVPDAQIEGLWNAEEVWHSSFGTTDEEGLARLRGCRPGPLWLRVRADGFVEWDSGREIDFYRANEEPYSITIEKGAALRGRCTFQGRPVEEFELRYWLRVADRGSAEVRDAEGRFSIDDVPVGVTSIMAYAPGVGSSDVAEVDTRDDTKELVLELRSFLRGKGRVVDGLTGEPVAGAEVMLHNRLPGGSWLTEYGPSTTTDGVGEFELGHLRVGPNHVHTESSSHRGGRTLYIEGPAEGAVDLGEIRVARKDPLYVRIVGSEDPTQNWVRGVTDPRTKWQRFDEDGGAVIEGLFPGYQSLQVTTSDDRIIDHSVVLNVGEPWETVVDVTPEDPDDEGLIVEIETENDDDLEPILSVMITTILADGTARFDTYARNGRTTVPVKGPFGEHAVLELYAPGTGAVAAEDVVVRDWLGVPLRMSPAPSRTLQVLDDAGRPVTRASVWLMLGDQAFFYQETDTAGRVQFFLRDRDDLFATVSHERLGGVHKEPVSLSDSPATIRLGGGGVRFSVRLVDESGPVAGLTPVLQSPAGITSFLTLPLTDAEGRSHTESVTEGDYLLFATGTGYTSSPMPLTVRASGTEVTYRLRSLGALEVLVRGGDGGPLAGVSFEATHEDGGALGAWADEGRILASPRNLTSDPSGILSLAGLPSGTYRWTASAEGDAVAEGTVTVEAFTVRHLTVDL